MYLFQLEAANRRIKELEEQVGLEMQARDEVEHNYRYTNFVLSEYSHIHIFVPGAICCLHSSYMMFFMFFLLLDQQ